MGTRLGLSGTPRRARVPSNAVVVTGNLAQWAWTPLQGTVIADRVITGNLATWQWTPLQGTVIVTPAAITVTGNLAQWQWTGLQGTVNLGSDKIGDGDGTSGGNFGRIMPPILPRKTPRVTDNVTPIRKQAPLRDFSEILTALRGIAESPTPKGEEITRVLNRFEASAPEKPVTEVGLAQALANMQAQNQQFLENLESRVFFELEKIRSPSQESEIFLTVLERAFGENQSEQDRRKLLTALESMEGQEAAQRARLVGLLMALAAA